MRGLLKWARRILLSLCLLIFVSIGLVLAILHTDWGRNKVRGEVESALVSVFPGGVKIGSLEGSIFGELRLHDVEIDNRDHRPFIEVSTLRVKVGLAALLKKHVNVEEAIADRVTISIRPQPPAPPKPPEPPKPDSSPSAWTVSLPAIEVHDGAVIMNDEPLVDRIEIAAALRILQGGAMEAELQLGAEWQKRVVTAVGSIRMSRGAIEVPALTAQVGEGWFTAHQVAFGGTGVGSDDITGNLAGFFPRTLATAVRPSLVLPGDVIVAGSSKDGIVDLTATMAGMAIRGRARADFSKQTATGVFAATGVELAPVGVRGRGDVTAVFSGTMLPQPDVRGMVKVIGEIGDVPASSVLVAGDLVGEHGSVIAIAKGAGHARVALAGALARKGPRITITHGNVAIGVDDPVAASGGLSPVTGKAQIKFGVLGQLAPAVDLHVVEGTLSGSKLAYDDFAASTLSGRFDVDHIPESIAVVGDVALDGVSQAGTLLGKVTATASNNVRTKTIAVTATARPAMAALTATIDATVRRDVLPITIQLGKHTITGDNGVTWTGRGGSVVLGDRAIEIKGIRSESAGGAVTIAANIAKPTKVITARIGATSIPLSLVDPTYRGVVAADVAITKRGSSITGTASVDGTGISTVADAPPLDTKLTVALGNKVEITAQATNPQLGSVTLASTIKPPTTITDAAAWKHLERTAIETATLTLHHLDAGAAAKGYAKLDAVTGIVDSQIELAGTQVSGTIAIAGVAAKQAGVVDATVTLTPSGAGDVHAETKVTSSTIGTANIDVDAALPAHLFDPAAWRALGMGALRSAVAQVPELAVDDGLIERLGLDLPYRGRLASKIEIGPGASTVTATFDVIDLHGGAVIKPVAVHATLDVDGTGTTAEISMKSGTLDLASVHAKMPVATDRALELSKAGWLATPIQGIVTFGTATSPSVSIPELLAVIGRSDATAGGLEGEIDISGTLGTPLLDAPALAVTKLAVVARVADRPPPTLDTLKINAHWDGTGGSVEADGAESSGGTLHVKLVGQPATPSTFEGQLRFKSFDLSPLAVLLPTRLLGAAGLLEADVSVKGDPRTNPILGTINLTGGRVPIGAAVGTLRSATVVVTLEPKLVKLVADGKIGAGSIHVDAKATGDGPGTFTIDRAEITANLRKFSPIGAIEPEIDADIEATLMHAGETWHGPVKVKHGNVVVTPKQGDKLLAVNVPSDLHMDRSLKGTQISFTAHHSTDKPLLLLGIDIDPEDPVNIRAAIDPVDFRGALSGSIVVSVGDDVGISQTLHIDRGDLDLFGHRYQVDRARMTFDDSTDPELDILLIHEFPDVQLRLAVTGMLSAPERRISTDPDRGYDDAQLYGFVLGGEPGGDPNAQSREAASAAGASILSAKVSKYIKKVLPFGLDVIRYEAATSSNSQALVFGRWINSQLFVGYRQHLVPRPDENNGELSAEYYLRHNILIETTFGDRQYEGLDLLWRHRY